MSNNITRRCFSPGEHEGLIDVAGGAMGSNAAEFSSLVSRMGTFVARAVNEEARNVLHIAAICGNNEILEWVLPYAKDYLGNRDCDGWTPLHGALYYGCIHSAVVLLNHGSSLYSLDIEGFDPLELAYMDICRKVEGQGERKQVKDLYVWGVNSNYSLGQGDAKSRDKPELLLELWKKKISVTQVAISKFHSVILTEAGQVYSCGHGRGGRLGHGNEDTVLYPKPISELKGVYCNMVAASHDHSLFLDELGQVYSCGLNSFNQLGIMPSPKQCLTPSQIIVKSLKGKIFVGIAAARFHSVMHTETELYTFGLNAGQLGHASGEEFQIVPKLVTYIQRKEANIHSVVACDGATICSLRNGDIFILQRYVCKRIASRLCEVRLISCSGGCLNNEFFKNMHFKDPEPLQISVLLKDGTVLQWRKDSQAFKKMSFDSKLNNKKVIDIAQGKCLMAVTDDGLVFECTTKPCCKGDETPTVETAAVVSKNATGKLQVSLCAEQQHSDAKRVRLLYNARRIFSDAKSRNFAVSREDPGLSFQEYPTVSESTFGEDFVNLLEQADLADNIHDLVVKGPGYSLPCHKFILNESIPGLSNLCHDNIDGVEYVEVKSPGRGFSEVWNWLREVYRGSFSENLLHDGTADKKKAIPVIDTEEVSSGEDSPDDLLSRMMQLSTRDLADPLIDDTPIMPNRKWLRNKRSNVKKERRDTRTQNRMKTAIEDQRHVPKIIRFCDWKSREDLSDIDVKSSDGITFKCHKCVLVARLGYFQGMLCNEWMETNLLKEAVSMPVPGKVLEVILNYLYSDDVAEIRNCEDVEFLWHVIVAADQFLVGRLKEMGERRLATLVTIRNAVDILEFSCIYNADQLKAFCCHYIGMNICYFVESRMLESLSSQSLLELSKGYRKQVARMGHRVMTEMSNYLDHLMEDMLLQEKYFKQLRRYSEKRTGSAKKCAPSSSENVRNSEAPKQKETPEQKGGSTGRTRRNSRNKKKTSPHVQELSSSEPKENMDKVDCVLSKKVDSEGRETNNLETGTESLPVEGKESDAFSRWAQHISPLQHSFRSILAEEEGSRIAAARSSEREREAITTSKVGIQVTVARGSAKKKSQKERKKELLEARHGVNLDDQSNSKTLEETPCPWATVSVRPTTQQSLRDVIADELKEVPREDTVPSKQTSFSRRLSERTTDVSSKSWRSPQEVGSATNSQLDFSAIMKRQEGESEELSRRSQKPLRLIQTEEKAMEELQEHYSNHSFGSEYVTVTRIVASVASPMWDVQRGLDIR